MVASMQSVILAEDRTVRGEQVLDVGLADADQAGDEVDEVRAVVSVDDPDAAVAEDVVAGEEQVAHPQGELAGGVAGRAPDLQLLVADPDSVPLVDRPVDLATGHWDVDALCVDACIGQDLVPFLDGGDALGVGGDLAAEDFAGAGEALGVIDVGVGGDDQLAGRQAEIHLADQLEHVRELIEEADVDRGELGAAVDEVDVHTQSTTGLVVHLQHARKDITPLDHAEFGLSMRVRDRFGLQFARHSTPVEPGAQRKNAPAVKTGERNAASGRQRCGTPYGDAVAVEPGQSHEGWSAT